MEFGKAMEQDFWIASLSHSGFWFWKTIRWISREKQWSTHWVDMVRIYLVVKGILQGSNLPLHVHPEFLKALNFVGLSWLASLCNIEIWSLLSGELGWWFPSLRSGTGGCAPITGWSGLPMMHRTFLLHSLFFFTHNVFMHHSAFNH